MAKSSRCGWFRMVSLYDNLRCDLLLPCYSAEIHIQTFDRKSEIKYDLSAILPPNSSRIYHLRPVSSFGPSKLTQLDLRSAHLSVTTINPNDYSTEGYFPVQVKRSLVKHLIEIIELDTLQQSLDSLLQ